MPRAAPARAFAPDIPDPVERPLAEIAGDIRDRLATLVNTTQLIRFASADGDNAILSSLRRIDEQVRCLGRLADELCQSRGAELISVSGHNGRRPSGSRSDA